MNRPITNVCCYHSFAKMSVSDLQNKNKQTIKSSDAKAKSSKDADSCNIISNARYYAADIKCE